MDPLPDRLLVVTVGVDAEVDPRWNRRYEFTAQARSRTEVVRALP